MDFKELETFIKVAEYKNFSKTAEIMDVTQPTVTNHIQSLEKELNAVLINRKGRKISLTESGRIFYRYAIDIINSCKMAKYEINTNKKGLGGHLVIESCMIPRKYYLPNILKKFLDHNNNITFSISGDDPDTSLLKLKNRELDFAITGFLKEDEDLEFIKILKVDNLLAIPKDCPYDNFSTVDASIFKEHRFIVKESSIHIKQHVFNKLDQVGLGEEDINPIGFTSDLNTVKELLSLGLGITLMPKKEVINDIKENKYKAVYIENLDMTRDFYFVYPKNRHMDPISESFKNFILKNKIIDNKI